MVPIQARLAALEEPSWLAPTPALLALNPTAGIGTMAGGVTTAYAPTRVLRPLGGFQFVGLH